MPTFHQAKHFPGHPAHLQRLPVEFAFKRIQRSHDIRDRAVSMILRVGASVFRAFSQTPGFVSRTIFSQKSTPTRLSWKMLWSNMYSAASPRLTIHSAIAGGLIPYAIFWAYTEQVA